MVSFWCSLFILTDYSAELIEFVNINNDERGQLQHATSKLFRTQVARYIV